MAMAAGLVESAGVEVTGAGLAGAEVVGAEVAGFAVAVMWVISCGGGRLSDADLVFSRAGRK